MPEMFPLSLPIFVWVFLPIPQALGDEFFPPENVPLRRQGYVVMAVTPVWTPN